MQTTVVGAMMGVSMHVCAPLTCLPAPQEAAHALLQQDTAAGQPMATGSAAGGATEAELDGRVAGAVTGMANSIEIWRLCYRQPEAFEALLHAVVLSRWVLPGAHLEHAWSWR